MMFPILFGLAGILVGIIINRAADNLPPPAAHSILASPRCAYCNEPRGPLEQSGLLSFLLLRDRCHACRAPLPIRAPLVEFGTALLFSFLAARFQIGLTLLADCAFTTILLLLAVIDLEHKLILNIVVLPATLLALLSAPVVIGQRLSLDSSLMSFWINSALGTALGYLLVFPIYLFGKVLVRALSRRSQMSSDTVAFGKGDVKLAGLLGALVGFPNVLYVIIYAILLGGVGAFVTILIQIARKRGYSVFTAIPYGPYFIVAGWFYMFGSYSLFNR